MVVRALDGLAGVGMLDGTQRRELARLRDRSRRPRTRRTGKGNSTPAAN